MHLELNLDVANTQSLKDVRNAYPYSEKQTEIEILHDDSIKNVLVCQLYNYNNVLTLTS